MHQSSYDKMVQFKEKYLRDKIDKTLSIFDIGSQDVNGSYKPIFEEPNWKYTGIDMAAGKNVDIVIKSLYEWKEIKTHSADIVISGQAFEHIEYNWLTMLEISRILKPGGLCCIIAPAGGFEHKYPIDCWRIYPDGFKALSKFSNLEVLEVYTQWEPENYPDGSDVWQDSVLIAKKEKFPTIKRTKQLMAHILIKIGYKILSN